MKIRISIKNYQRKDMLLSLLAEIDSFIEKEPSHEVFVQIIDDCSQFSRSFVKSLKKPFYTSPRNLGKKEHWKLWNWDLLTCEQFTDTDLFIFIPSDYSNIEFDRIIEQAKKLSNSTYFFNIINDGRTTCWNRNQPEHKNEEYAKVYFSDCAFFTNYRSLSTFGFYINEVHLSWFREKGRSSGVGHQFTNRLNSLGIDIFHPYNSFASHGLHESVMHPTERKRTPLVSIKKFSKDKPVVVGIATFKGREEALKLCLQSLNSQTVKIDKIYVYDNSQKEDLSDNGKFEPLHRLKESCYFFPCDDDIIYPPTYIEDMLNAINRYKCIVTHHGRTITGLGRNYYSGHKAYGCLRRNLKSYFIDVAGTGVTAFDTDYFNPVDIHLSNHQRMADCVFSLAAAEEEKKIFLLPHSRGYFQQIPIDHSKSCFSIESKRPIEQGKIADKIFRLKNK